MQNQKKSRESFHFINRTDAHPVPCRFGENVTDSMTDGIDTGRGNAELIHQNLFHRISTTLGEFQVVFFRAFRRCIAIDGDIHVRIVLQVFRHMLDACHLRSFHIRLVETESHYRFHDVDGIAIGSRLLGATFVQLVLHHQKLVCQAHQFHILGSHNLTQAVDFLVHGSKRHRVHRIHHGEMTVSVGIGKVIGKAHEDFHVGMIPVERHLLARIVARQVEDHCRLDADIKDKFILSTDAEEAGDVIAMMDEIRQLPFVKKVALSRGYPTGVHFSTAIQLENSTDLTPVKLLICDTEAFGMWDFDVREDFGAPLAHSIWFSENLYNCFDSREEAEKKAKSWNGNFNRTRIDNFGGVLGNIAGDNAMNERMDQSKVAVIVLPIDDFGLYNNTILIETDDNHDESVEAFDSIYRKFSDEYNGVYIEPWEFGYVEDMMVRELEEDNQTVKLLKIFAMLAVILSVLGLVAMSTYFASEREKGIAIRKVFGGTMASETRRNILEYMIITLIGSAVALPVAWIFCGRYLEEFAYRIDLTIWPFALAALLALVISLASVLWQTLRAARTNPAEALKKE